MNQRPAGAAAPSWRAWSLALAAIFPAAGILFALGVADGSIRTPTASTLLWFLFLAPLVEEIIFRGGLQERLLRWRATALGPLSLANIIASLAFVAAHLFYHPIVWALATVLPSLVFGWLYEHGRALWRPILLHSVYNAVFFGVLAGS